MNFNYLLELRSASLAKLEKAPLIDVISDYPLDFVRIIISKLQKKGFNFSNDNISHLINSISDELKNRTDKSNVFINKSSSGYKISLVDQNTKHDIDITIALIGNKVSWSASIGYSVSISNPKLVDANTQTMLFVNKLADALYYLKKIYKTRFTDKNVFRKIDAKYNVPKPKLIRILSKKAKKFNLILIGSKYKSSDTITINVKPSFDAYNLGSEYSGNDITYSYLGLKDRDWDSFNFSFQIDSLKKMLPFIYRELSLYNYWITKIGFGSNEYLYIIAEQTLPNKKVRSVSNKNIIYKDYDEENKRLIKEKIEALYSEAKQMSLEDALRIFIKSVFEKERK